MKEIGFDELMSCVKYIDCKVSDMYVLTLDGKTHQFSDTSEVVPFVEEKLGYTVVF